GIAELIAEQHQHRRWRKNLRQRRGGCDRAGGERLVVAVPQHGGQRDQSHRHRGSADNALGGGEQHTNHDNRNAQPAWEPANRRPMVSSRSSAMRERSSITPMKMKSGMASSTSLFMTPKMRCGSAPSRPKSIVPLRVPIIAKANDTPPSVSATGYPAISAAQTATTSSTARPSAPLMAA